VRDGKGFSTSFLMRIVAISAEALHLLATVPPAPFPLLALGLPKNPYIRPRLIILRLRDTTRCTQIFPWLARTGPWKSRSLRDVRRIQSSLARVKTGDHVFGSATRMTTRYFFFLFVAGSSEHRHCFLSALHRVGRLHRQVLCQLAPA
jgi:hypothetical protein